jgi:hypothetical protein
VGYVRQKLLAVTLDGEEFDELEIRVRSVPIGVWLDALELCKGGVAPIPAHRDRYMAFAEIVGASLVSWTLQVPGDDGDPVDVPCTTEGLLSVDKELTGLILNAWQDEQGGVRRDPLPETGDSPVIPMAPVEATA